MREPLHQFIDRNLGPRDLFGLLTTESSWTDLVLGQQDDRGQRRDRQPEWLNPPRLSSTNACCRITSAGWAA